MFVCEKCKNEMYVDRVPNYCINCGSDKLIEVPDDEEELDIFEAVKMDMEENVLEYFQMPVTSPLHAPEPQKQICLNNIRMLIDVFTEEGDMEEVENLKELLS